MLYLLPLIVFSGLLIGLLIRHFCKEEIKPGKKYIKITELIIILLISILLFYFNFTNTYLTYIAIILGILSSFVLKEKYFYFSLALLTLNFYIASLIFIFGIVSGSKKIVRKIFLFFPPLLLLLTALELSYFTIFAASSILTLFFIKSQSLLSK